VNQMITIMLNLGFIIWLYNRTIIDRMYNFTLQKYVYLPWCNGLPLRVSWFNKFKFKFNCAIDPNTPTPTFCIFYNDKMWICMAIRKIKFSDSECHEKSFIVRSKSSGHFQSLNCKSENIIDSIWEMLDE
jgi:hypothetical protein